MLDQSKYDLYVHKLDSCLKAYRAGALDTYELTETWELLHDMMLADYLNGYECLEPLIEDMIFRTETSMH